MCYKERLDRQMQIIMVLGLYSDTWLSVKIHSLSLLYGPLPGLYSDTDFIATQHHSLSLYGPLTVTQKYDQISWTDRAGPFITICDLSILDTIIANGLHYIHLRFRYTCDDNYKRFAIIVPFAVFVSHWNVRYSICDLSTITVNMLHLQLSYLRFWSGTFIRSLYGAI